MEKIAAHLNIIANSIMANQMPKIDDAQLEIMHHMKILDKK